MKNKCKIKTIILLCIWIILLILIPFITQKLGERLSSNTKSYISSEFDIDEYNVILDVDKDNKIDVTEIITVDIPTDEYNGIYKSIPLWLKYYDKNLKFSKKKISITNLRAIGEKFVIDEFNDKIGIRIGSTKTNIDKGLHTYTIKYRYNIGKDSISNYDELVFNLFDHYDNTKINNMNVTVNMPKEFGNDVTFFKEKENITNKVNYQISDTTINIKIDNYILDDTLTMNIMLPNNYFVSGTYNYGFLSLVICLGIICVSIGSVVVWKKYNINSNKRVQTVELYAPDNLDPAQIGYIYGEKNIKKLVVSLIISLASKNYILLNEIEKNKYNVVNIGKKNNGLKKLSIAEHLVYQELFKNSDSNILSEDHSFPTVFSKVAESLEKGIAKKINDNGTKKIMNTIFTFLVCSIALWLIAYLFINDLEPKFGFLYIISFIAIFITGFMTIIMNYKTDYGQIIIAKVKGFKNYLETAEKYEIDSWVNNNPNYFYDILPYAYVLNVSDKWIQNFMTNNIPYADINFLNYSEDNLFMIMSE